MEAVEPEEAGQAPREPKSKAPVALILVVGVLTMGASAAGAFFGLRYAAPLLAAKGEQQARKAEEPVEVIVARFEPIVVDARSADGAIHHLKVGLSFELAAGASEEQFEKLAPRGREAATLYLRGQKFEDMVGQFERVRKELSDSVIRSMGKERIARVLITDFVAQ